MQTDARQDHSGSPALALQPAPANLPCVFVGSMLCNVGSAMYFAGVLFAVIRISLALREPFRAWNEALVWYLETNEIIGIGATL